MAASQCRQRRFVPGNDPRFNPRFRELPGHRWSKQIGPSAQPDRIGQFRRSASARREVMSSLM
jgi:hypothetical protein